MVSLIILFLIIPSVTSLTTPVLILDPKATLPPGNISSSPFHKMTPIEFTNIIHEAIHLSETILIFVEDSFCVEDISSKDSYGSPFKNIHRDFLEEKARYISSVVDPFGTLQRLLPPLESNVVYVRDQMKPLDKNFKYHYVYFTGASAKESRVQRLRRHDALIDQALGTFSTQLPGPVLAFYTGKSNPMPSFARTSYKRTAPKNESSDKTAVFSVTNDKAIIKLWGVVHHKEGMIKTPLLKPESTTAKTFVDKRMTARFFFVDDVELDFNFVFLDDSWVVESIVFLEGSEVVGRTDLGFGAPYDYAYYCAEQIMVVNTRDKSYVTIDKYQLEPLGGKNKTDNKTLRFQEDFLDFEDFVREGSTKEHHEATTHHAEGNESHTSTKAAKTAFTNVLYCGTNYNVQILSGLFLVAVVMVMMAFAMIMLFDCKSNNRMDDPDQTPLTAPVQFS